MRSVLLEGTAQLRANELGPRDALRPRRCGEKPVRLRIEDDGRNALACRKCHMSYMRHAGSPMQSSCQAGVEFFEPDHVDVARERFEELRPKTSPLVSSDRNDAGGPG